MLKGSSIFLGLMLTGSLTAAVLVSDGEVQPDAVVTPSAKRTSSGKQSAEAQRTLPVLRLDKLASRGLGAPEQDPFAGKSWYVPPPPPPPPPPAPPVVQAPPPPPPPSPPPLLFTYLGRMEEEDGRVVVYLMQNSRPYAASEGEMIDSNYRLDSISPTKLALTYVPLNAKQTLPIGSAPQ